MRFLCGLGVLLLLMAGLHIGIYLGGLIGTVWGIVRIRRATRAVGYASA